MIDKPKIYGIVYLTSRLLKGEVIKRYIGQHRLKNGVVEDGYLGSGKLLRHAIDKYGKECFFRETLQFCYSQKELNEAEIQWIKFYDSVASKDFYNLADGGHSFTNLLRKKVYQYTLAGDFVAEHESVEMASIVAGCAASQMTITASSEHRTAMGYQWRFEYREFYPQVKKGVDREIHCYSMDGIFIRSFSSLTKAANFIGENTTGNLAACAKGKKLTVRGYQWRYEKFEKINAARAKRQTNKPMFRVDPDTLKVLERYESANLAGRTLGVAPANIHRSANSGYLCGGYFWKYAD